MCQIHFLKFTFNSNVERDISNEGLDYLRNFFSVFFNKDYGISPIQSNYRTIPISFREILNNATILESTLIDLLINEYKAIDREYHFKTNDLVLIDVQTNIRAIATNILLSGIEELVKNDNSDNPRFVLLVNNVLECKASNIINGSIEIGKVLLIDKKKRFLYKSQDYKVNHDFSYNSLSATSIIKTKYKLLRKIGHYTRYEDAEKQIRIACNTFFYDGDDCENDISQFLFERIVKFKLDKWTISQVIYESNASPWLKNALLSLDNDLELLKNDYNLESYKGLKSFDIVDSVIVHDKETILLVVDYIYSAKTFKSIYSTVRKIYPKSIIFPIAVLAGVDSMQSKNNIEIKGGLIPLNIEKEHVEIEYLLEVKQIRYGAKQKCLMCHELGIENIKDSSYVNKDVLNSFEFWIMCDESGYKPEEHWSKRPPDYPERLKIKPNSIDLFKENSAYLALKYITQLELNKFYSPDLIIIFPDETSNKNNILFEGQPLNLEDTPSGYFAETLMQLKQIEYFGIPREILDKMDTIHENKFDTEFLEDKIFDDFNNKLESLPEDIVIMDEFGFSGTTLHKIIEILKLADRKRKGKGKKELNIAYFPIFNFNPNLLNESEFNIPMLSLYEMNLINNSYVVS